MTALIKLSVFGQVSLRDDTKNATRVDDHGGVAKTTERAERGSHSKSRKQVRARDAKALQGRFEYPLPSIAADQNRAIPRPRPAFMADCSPAIVKTPQPLPKFINRIPAIVYARKLQKAAIRLNQDSGDKCALEASYRVIRRFLVLLAFAMALGACTTLVDGDMRAMQPIPASLVADMREREMSPADPILIRIFKKESELEVWKQDRSGKFALLRTYPMCRWSGRLGPKTKNGDRQAPEGFYSVTPALMNPKSQYYLSFNIGYPNQLEQALGYTGEAIMVHGACSSSGCFALTDEGVAEIYAVAREAFKGGQAAFQVQVFPFRMTPANMAVHREDPNIAFWRNLEEGYDFFEVKRQEPKLAACGRRYVFNTKPTNGAILDPLLPCPDVETMTDPALVAHLNAENAELAAFAASGRAVPAAAYVDGGMHPVFRDILSSMGEARLAKQTSLEEVPISRPKAALADPYIPAR